MNDGKEVRQYLQRFAAVEQARFGVIKVGGAIVRDDLETLADALAFLHSVGLTPVVVHGAGPQLDAELAARGVASPRVNGLRVTTPEVLSVARDVFTQVNLELVDAVRRAGARAAAVPRGVFDAELLDEDGLGLVGTPTRARLELIQSATRAGAIPVLTSLGETPTGQLVNINADAAVRALVEQLTPYKIVFLTEAGGVLDGDGEVISTINLATDREALFAAPWLSGGMRVKVDEIASLLDVLPLTASVSITRPEALALELFTHTGAGTLVRRGERVLQVREKADLDPARSRALVAAAFGADPGAPWWDALALTAAYVSENYRAGAFITQMPDDVGYLDKYAVEPDARGEGLSQAVWRIMRQDWPRLVWRSRADNPINAFYFRECDGATKSGAWTVFWCGFDGPAEAAGAVADALARPDTFGRRS